EVPGGPLDDVEVSFCDRVERTRTEGGGHSVLLWDWPDRGRGATQPACATTRSVSPYARSFSILHPSGRVSSSPDLRRSATTVAPGTTSAPSASAASTPFTSS